MLSSRLRRSHIRHIESSIEKLNRRASRLLEQERQLTEEVEARDALEPAGGVRAMWARRVLRRRRARLGALRRRRSELVDGRLRSIMFALQEESQRTRDELDRLLERLSPIEQRWEGLRGTFDALEETISGPAFATLAEQWQGRLEIPDFPVERRDGYAKPFPQSALLF